MSTVTDRTAGIIGDFGIKAPVTCCATTDIVLNGEQTIDGVLTNESDVLLTGQTDTTENGIYTSDTGDWTRRADFDGSRDARKGTLVKVVSGTANYGYWSVTTSNPVIPDGSMAIAFSRDSSTLAVISAYMQSLLGAASYAALMTALGFSTFFLTLINAASATALNALLGLGTLALKNTVESEDLSDSAIAMLPMINGTIVTSVGSSALTIAIKTKAGADPSATDPVLFIFRNSTASTGDYTVISVTAALSLVVSSGSTLGTTSATAARLYLTAHNDAGTVRLGIFNPLAGTAPSLSLVRLQDDNLYSSTAEGGAGGADSAQVIYTTAAVANKALRVIGYLEATEATAGTWATAPSKVQLMGPGVPRTFDTMQSVRSESGAVSTGSTVIPGDDTPPLIGEGVQVFAQAIVPVSAINLLHVRTQVTGANSAASGFFGIALFQDATSASKVATMFTLAGAGAVDEEKLDYQAVAGTTSSTSFSVRMGCSGAGTTTINGQGGGRLYGGVMNSYIQIEEIVV